MRNLTSDDPAKNKRPVKTSRPTEGNARKNSLLRSLRSLAAKPTMQIIAHRGASHEAPENTLSAIRLAWQQKADAAEVDVQLSGDGRLVVIHDASTRRTGGRARRVGEQTLAQLRGLDVGRWKNQRGARSEERRV